MEWVESFDDHDNSIWEAASNMVPGEEEMPFEYRIKQRLVANHIEWYDASDEDIRTEETTWWSLALAKAAITQISR